VKRSAITAAVAAVALVVAGGTSATGAQPSPGVTQISTGSLARGGSFTLSGAEARAFAVPNDVVKVWSTSFPNGTTQTRYQQLVAGAKVLGGQLTVLADPSGRTTAVVGAYFPDLQVKNSPSVTVAGARGVAAQRIGSDGKWSSTLRIDPRDGRLFHEVVNQRFDHRWVQWIDAASGAMKNQYDAIAHGDGDGVGVKGDTKELDTVRQGSNFLLQSADGRQRTYDAMNRTALPGTPMTDTDNHWNLVGTITRSPSQPAGVDAHYYAGVVDSFYNDEFGRDSVNDNGLTIVSSAHLMNGLCNAFWNGMQMAYGDGDGRTCLPLSGALDVVGHELTHGVTQYTSHLIYQNESGALNEAFSDMMGTTIEFYADRHDLDPAGAPDWLLGEDVVRPRGFRNLGDPQENGNPDHYSELRVGDLDNGFVHSNSGIPNHAYYLAANGGRNAGCDAVGSNGHRHTADCDVTVRRVGLEDAAQVFYAGFTSLPEYANMCDARNATVAVAGSDARRISQAWAAVGVHSGCAPGTPPPPPCVGDPDAQLPFGTPHPYGNNGNCTWTYDHGTARFAFHFSLLVTERNFDHVIVSDGNGTVLARYTGRYTNGATSPCITTPKGSVRFTSDGGVVAQGFTVDAVVRC
jgi:bacillolysin